MQIKNEQPASAPASTKVVVSSARPAIDDVIERHIGEKLRQAYADVLTEPVPQRFVDLLDRLARGEAS